VRLFDTMEIRKSSILDNCIRFWSWCYIFSSICTGILLSIILPPFPSCTKCFQIWNTEVANLRIEVMHLTHFYALKIHLS